jgi:hypothetical protein
LHAKKIRAPLENFALKIRLKEVVRALSNLVDFAPKVKNPK